MVTRFCKERAVLESMGRVASCRYMTTHGGPSELAREELGLEVRTLHFVNLLMRNRCTCRKGFHAGF